MDQNQTVDNDLQKAIDDITNNTNIDPVFSDPVAAPSSLPEGDTGELDEPVGPFAAPGATVPTPSQGPGDFISEPTVPPLEGFGTPVIDVPGSPMVAPVAPAPVPEAAPMNVAPPLPQDMPLPPQPTPEPVAPDPSIYPPVQAAVTTETTVDSSASGLSMRQVKTAALRDLVPLIDRLRLSPSQRFNMCRNIFEDLRDYSVLEQAYKAASEIPDSTERAEALLYLVESIDKM